MVGPEAVHAFLQAQVPPALSAPNHWSFFAARGCAAFRHAGHVVWEMADAVQPVAHGARAWGRVASLTKRHDIGGWNTEEKASIGPGLIGLMRLAKAC